MCIAETYDRLVAAPCVEGDQQVRSTPCPRFEDADVMAEITENARPSQGSDTVALTGTGWSGGDDVDFQRQKITTKALRKAKERLGKIQEKSESESFNRQGRQENQVEGSRGGSGVRFWE